MESPGAGAARAESVVQAEEVCPAKQRWADMPMEDDNVGAVGCVVFKDGSSRLLTQAIDQDLPCRDEPGGMITSKASLFPVEAAESSRRNWWNARKNIAQQLRRRGVALRAKRLQRRRTLNGSSTVGGQPEQLDYVMMADTEYI